MEKSVTKNILKAMMLLIVIIFTGKAQSSDTQQSKEVAEGQMKAYARAREFYDVEALLTLFHPQGIKVEEDALLKKYARFRKAYPKLSLNDESSDTAIRSALRLKENVNVSALKSAFTQVKRGDTSSAVLEILADGWLPLRGYKVLDSKWEFARFEFPNLAVFYLIEKRGVLNEQGILGSLSNTLRYIVKFASDESGNWWLRSWKLSSY